MGERSKLRMGSVNQGRGKQRTGINFWLHCFLAVNVCLKLLLSFAELGIIASLAFGGRGEFQNWII